MKVLLPTCLTVLSVCMLSMSAAAQTHDAPAHALTCASTGQPPAMDMDNHIQMLAKQWTAGTAMPGQKCYHGAAYLDDAVYVFGGLGGNLRFDVTAFVFDIAAAAWAPIKSLPMQRGLPAVETVNGNIYIIGGYSATNPFTVQAPVLKYDPIADTYTEKASMPVPVFGAGSFVHNGRIFVLGGGTTAFTTSIDAIQIYDPQSDQWTVSSSRTPFTSWGTGVVAINNTALYIGGVKYTNGQGLFGAWSYSGAISGDAITWTQIADYPDGSIMRHSAGTDGTLAYFTGGYRQESMNSGPPSGMTYSYDPSGNVWAMHDVKPTGVYFASQMVYDERGNLYVTGGNDAARTVTDAVEIFDVTAEGGPIALFACSTFDVWLKSGTSTTCTVNLQNLGSKPMVWTATIPSGTDWLTMTTQAGVVEAGMTAAIPMRITSGAGVGSHSVTLAFTTGDPDLPTADITVDLHVQDEDIDTEMNVVLEEGTGTWCGFCPYGADSLKAMMHDYPGRVFGIAYHGGSTSEPMFTPHTDFWKNLVGLTGWPNGSVNRIVFDGGTRAALSRSVWRARVEEVLQTRRSPISLHITDKSYDPGTKDMSLTVEVLFHRGFSESLSLNIAQLQSRMNYTQSFYPSGGGSQKLFPYYHDHVLRQMIPNDKGELITSGTAVASQSTITKTFNFTSVDSTVATCSFVIFAHMSDGTNFGEIIQAEELELSSFVTDVQPLPAHAPFVLHVNYPNPFNPSTTIQFDVPLRSQVDITIVDALGRTVAQPVHAELEAGRHHVTWNATGFPSGSYFVTMRAGQFRQTRTLTFMK